jgi:single-strand DNA-binding protein
MNLNTAVFEGNLADAPQLNHTIGSQIPVTEAVVLVNRRVKDDADQWVDAEPTRHRIKAWRSLAEHLANLPKGTTVLVVGTTTTEAWPDKETGQKRTSDVVIVDAIGASLRFSNVYPESAHGQPSSTDQARSDADQTGA